MKSRDPALEQSEDAAALRPPGKLGDFHHFATVARHGVCQALLPTAKTVSRESTLGEHNQLRPVRGGLFQTRQDPVEVFLDVSKLRLHLHGCRAYRPR